MVKEKHMAYLSLSKEELKYRLLLEIYIKNIFQFTENLIIFYTIIHELSGIKQCEPRIENKPFKINYNS